MANELKHKSQGTSLTQAEYENVDAHIFDGQATGDSVEASSATQLSRKKNNISASTAPGVSNDNTEDYKVGSLWLDLTADKAYICLDVSTGAAVWTEITQGGVTASSTDTFTNKTIDANGTGNVITNIGASEIEIGLITGHSELSAGPAETDEVLLSDAGAFKKINVVELLNPENFTAVTLPAAADEVFINDAGTGKKITHDDLLFGANGTPSTQAHGDSAAIGTALDAARSDHKHGMPAAGGGGGGAVTREGGDTTEATTTSTSVTELSAITSLTIAAATPFEILLSARKTSGAVADAALGLRLNATVVDTPSASGSGIFVATGTNEAQNGGTNVLVRPRVTNYLNGNQHHSSTRTTSGGFKHSTFFTDSMDIADNPNAETTDVDTLGMTGSASITLGLDEEHIYSWATS